MASEKLSDLKPIDWAIIDAERALESAKEQFLDACKSLQDRLERAVRTVEQGYKPNSLGEVQGAGLDVDRYAAIIDQRGSFLRQLQWVRERTTKGDA